MKQRERLLKRRRRRIKRIIENLSNYFISKNGEVINIKTNKVLSKTKTDYGYFVSLVRDDGTRTTASVARLVAMEYCQIDSFNRIVKHKDGNRYNNNADNLLWYISIKEKKQNLDDSIDKFCVYLHTCIANNKKYIGITSQVPEQRWANGKGYHNIEFCKDIERYGWKDGFIHEILFSNLTEKEACNIESEYIKIWDLQNPDIGYNIAKGGLQTTLGYRHTEDSKIKMSNALKERFKNKENHPWTNQKHKKESKDKMKINNPNRKPVISVENNKEYISIKEATRQMNLKSKNSIIIALKDNKKTAGGYHWVYKEEN